MNDVVTLHHGSGGSRMHALIDRIFISHFSNPVLNEKKDAALLENAGSNVAFTTDTYVIDPIFFPGGDIGKLAVCGTLNALAVSFAKPVALSVAFVLEEGFPLSDLDRIARSMAAVATDAGVPVVTGDTKVVPRGKCDRVFINTTGIGVVEKQVLERIRRTKPMPGDRILLSGTLGDHAVAIILAREAFRFHAQVSSDCANLYPAISKRTASSEKIRLMRDITRGGLSSILHEITDGTNLGIDISEENIPVRNEVRAVCELLGFDPLDLANEGKFIAIAGEEDADRLLKILRESPGGENAALIGRITRSHPGKVMMTTLTGGARMVEMVSGEQLPRIC